jgi:enoyl-CoA hydratase/carnithine racemase
MTHPKINDRLADGVLTLTLLPPGPQGVQIDFIEALSQCFTDLPTRSEVRVVVVRGHLELPLDLKHWAALAQTEPVRAHRALQAMQRWRTRQLKTLPQAMVTVITGSCTGAALPLVEGSDLALCCDTATLGLTLEQAQWLSPGTEPAFDEPNDNFQRSLLHALTGQTLSAPQASDLGWVTFAYPVNELDAQVQALTQSLLDKDALALQFSKETLAHVPHMDWDASVSYTAAKFAEIKARQAEAAGPSSRANAIAGFLAGQSKPGLQG